MIDMLPYVKGPPTISLFVQPYDRRQITTTTTFPITCILIIPLIQHFLIKVLFVSSSPFWSRFEKKHSLSNTH